MQHNACYAQQCIQESLGYSLDGAPSAHGQCTIPGCALGSALPGCALGSALYQAVH